MHESVRLREQEKHTHVWWWELLGGGDQVCMSLTDGVGAGDEMEMKRHDLICMLISRICFSSFKSSYKPYDRQAWQSVKLYSTKWIEKLVRLMSMNLNDFVLRQIFDVIFVLRTVPETINKMITDSKSPVNTHLPSRLLELLSRVTQSPMDQKRHMIMKIEINHEFDKQRGRLGSLVSGLV